eukprot:TRINITY_DN42145_c0_g1_i1.p1 TRINITY_DN42145_c0_g1~~TRINITY_DN42145_c0_g1_i1.p1  ORF type:complete len:610 (+),score=100.13 TRINITY_DN42145_c0_g1_i1:51-1880(+)
MASVLSLGACEVACASAGAGAASATFAAAGGLGIGATSTIYSSCMAACTAKFLVEASAETAASGGTLGPVTMIGALVTLGASFTARRAAMSVAATATRTIAKAAFSAAAGGTAATAPAGAIATATGISATALSAAAGGVAATASAAAVASSLVGVGTACLAYQTYCKVRAPKFPADAFVYCETLKLAGRLVAVEKGLLKVFFGEDIGIQWVEHEQVKVLVKHEQSVKHEQAVGGAVSVELVPVRVSASFLTSPLICAECAQLTQLFIMTSPGYDHVKGRSDVRVRPKGTGEFSKLPGVVHDMNRMLELGRLHLHTNNTTVQYAENACFPKSVWMKYFVRPFLEGSSPLKILYYAGHGETTKGGMVLNESETLHFEDILHEFANHGGIDMKLVIIADSCHSGKLCLAHAEALSQGLEVAQRVAVLAATKPDQVAWESAKNGGKFTTWLLKWLDSQCLQEMIKDAKPLDNHDNVFELQRLCGRLQSACASFPTEWWPKQPAYLDSAGSDQSAQAPPTTRGAKHLLSVPEGYGAIEARNLQRAQTAEGIIRNLYTQLERGEERSKSMQVQNKYTAFVLEEDLAQLFEEWQKIKHEAPVRLSFYRRKSHESSS